MRRKIFISITAFCSFICVANTIYSQTNSIYGKNLIIFQEKNKWGFKDSEGNIIVPAKYANILEQKEGMMAVNRGGKNKTTTMYIMGNPFQTSSFEGGKWGFVNPEGEIVIPLQFENAKAFSNGKAEVYLTPEGKGTRIYYIDIKGEEITSK